jgi:plasmid stabilization system protein ParE
MSYRFSQNAKEEFLQSIEYYELQETGLGATFSEQVFSTIERIVDFPQGWTPLDDTFHRCLVKQFPYALIYTELNGNLIIVSVMNLHRKPDYWRHQ